MVNIILLKKKIADSEKKIEEIADLMGIDKSTLYRKLSNGTREFTVSEAKKLKDILSLSNQESISIFFN